MTRIKPVPVPGREIKITLPLSPAVTVIATPPPPPG